MLEACFADLLKGLVFDDEVMDWIVDALHQSHADEKKFRRDAIARLQDEQSKLQNRLDKLYDDRLDGFIEPDFFERKSREWRQTQKRLADQIGEYENAAHDYVQDGVRLLELAKKAYFLFRQQFKRKAEIAEFRVFEPTWKDQTLTATLRQPFDLLALPTRLGKEKKPPEALLATFVLNGGAYGTIFATFSCHHRQKCSVSCNSCEVSHNGETIDSYSGL